METNLYKQKSKENSLKVLQTKSDFKDNLYCNNCDLVKINYLLTEILKKVLEQI